MTTVVLVLVTSIAAADQAEPRKGETIMTEYDITDLSVCQDCIFLLANGGCDGCTTCAFSDDPDSEPCQTVADRMVEIWGDDTMNITPGCSDPDCECGKGEEPWFSWSSCDGCGSNLGGDRHRAHAVIPAS